MKAIKNHKRAQIQRQRQWQRQRQRQWHRQSARKTQNVIFLKSWWLTHSKYDDRYLTLAILFTPVTLVTLFWSYDQFYRAECITVSGFFLYISIILLLYLSAVPHRCTGWPRPSLTLLCLQSLPSTAACAPLMCDRSMYNVTTHNCEVKYIMKTLLCQLLSAAALDPL